MFEYSRKGYLEAIEFLKQTDNLHLVEKAIKEDNGFVVIDTANRIKNQKNS